MSETPPPEGPDPRWKEDFPVEWDKDHYMTRREMAKFLTLGSVLLAGASGAIAAAGGRFAAGPQQGPRTRIARSDEVPAGGHVLFRYPTDEDPCILVRTADGNLRAFSQVCTHLSCAVVHRPADGRFFCPCHRGWFEENSGAPAGGPPTRRLPRILLEEAGGEVFAVGREV